MVWIFISVFILWIFCGLLAFRIFMRQGVDENGERCYTYDPIDGLVLFALIAGGFISLFVALVLQYSSKKEHSLQKFIEIIVGKDIVDKGEK